MRHCQGKTTISKKLKIKVFQHAEEAMELKFSLEF